MAVLGIGPGPEVGEAYRFLLERRMELGPRPPEEAEAALLEWWAQRQAGTAPDGGAPDGGGPDGGAPDGGAGAPA